MCPLGKCPRDTCPGVCVLEGNCPGDKCPGGMCPWGKCPGDTCPGGGGGGVLSCHQSGSITVIAISYELFIFLCFLSLGPTVHQLWTVDYSNIWRQTSLASSYSKIH